MRYAILVAVLAVATLSAAEAPKPRTGSQTNGGADAGTAEAAAIFARQAKDNPRPTGPDPAVVGCYLWGGRADGNYKPFFQWELKLASGTQALPGLEARVVTLKPDRTVQAEGEWKPLDPLAANKALAFALRLNTVQFHPWRLDLRWQGGGAASFIAPDKSSIPQRISAESGVMAVGIDCVGDDKNKNRSQIIGSLWNLGPAPATGVVLTIRVLDDNGKELKKLTWSPKDKTIAAGAAVPVTLGFDGRPNVGRVSTSVQVAETVAGFTGAKDVEAGFLVLADGQLRGRIRNGTGADLPSFTVDLALLDAKGRKLFATKVEFAALAKEGEQAFAVAAPGVTAWAQVETLWVTK